MFYKLTNEDYVKWFDEFSISFDELTENQKEFLNNLNNRLRKIEKKFIHEALQLKVKPEKRVYDPNDWLKDYEIECYITFYIDETDPAYKEDSDNILIILDGSIKYTDDCDIGNDENYNEFKDFSNHPMKDENHCYLYHYLYNHSELGWFNMLRISRISIDFDVVYQTRINLTQESKDVWLKYIEGLKNR